VRIYDFNQLAESQEFADLKVVLTIGVYDGLHHGHMRVLTKTLELSGEYKSVVITFAQNPKALTGRYLYSKPLLSQRQSRQFFANLGVDFLVVIDFSPEFSKLSGEEFIARCCKMFSVQALVVGEDFRCGHKADTGVEELKVLIKQCHEETKLIVPETFLLNDGRVDSSTLVREALIEGKVSLIETLLGRNYSVDLVQLPLKVTESALFFKIDQTEQLLPPPGVYQSVLNYSDGSRREATARIDATQLVLTGEFPDNCSITYDNLEFVKEFK